jgi:hypothetical protein
MRDYLDSYKASGCLSDRRRGGIFNFNVYSERLSDRDPNYYGEMALCQQSSITELKEQSQPVEPERRGGNFDLYSEPPAGFTVRRLYSDSQSPHTDTLVISIS